jgi:hypothetical protein
VKQRDYSTLSTAALEKILDRSAQGSAEQRAVQKELRERGEGAPAPREDKQQLHLFIR